MQGLADLIEELGRLAAGGPSSPYETDRVQVIASRSQAQQPDFDVVKPWPLRLTPDVFDEKGSGWRCMAFEGTEGRTLLEVFSQSHP